MEIRMMLKSRNMLVTLVAAAIATACSVSTEDLAAEVQQDMEETLSDQGIKIKSFHLTKRGGNEYKGILETIEPHGEFTYSVEVIYDGKMFSWEVGG
jgi:hypothetical protein